MCEEISLLCAHICLMPSFHADKPIPVECRVISICIHYFYTGYSQAVLCYYKNRYYLKIIAEREKSTFSAITVLYVVFVNCFLGPKSLIISNTYLIFFIRIKDLINKVRFRQFNKGLLLSKLYTSMLYFYAAGGCAHVLPCSQCSEGRGHALNQAEPCGGLGHTCFHCPLQYVLWVWELWYSLSLLAWYGHRYNYHCWLDLDTRTVYYCLFDMGTDRFYHCWLAMGTGTVYHCWFDMGRGKIYHCWLDMGTGIVYHWWLDMGTGTVYHYWVDIGTGAVYQLWPDMGTSTVDQLWRKILEKMIIWLHQIILQVGCTNIMFVQFMQFLFYEQLK